MEIVKLHVVVKPGSKKTGIDKTQKDHWVVRVREAALEGRALVSAVAAELKIPKSHIRLIRGEKSRQKTLDIPDPCHTTIPEKKTILNQG